jgi:hypothetical protein
MSNEERASVMEELAGREACLKKRRGGRAARLQQRS